MDGMVHEASAYFQRRAAQERLQAKRPRCDSIVDQQRARARMMVRLTAAITMAVAQQLPVAAKRYYFALPADAIANRCAFLHEASAPRRGVKDVMISWKIGVSESGTIVLRADGAIGVVLGEEAYIDKELAYEDRAKLLGAIRFYDPVLYEVLLLAAMKLRAEPGFDRQFAHDIGLPHLVS